MPYASIGIADGAGELPGDEWTMPRACNGTGGNQIAIPIDADSGCSYSLGQMARARVVSDDERAARRRRARNGL